MDIYKPYPHNPPHWFVSNAIYMVTGSTLYKKPFLDNEEKRANFLETLFERTKIWGWVLHAWAVMVNHYHFIAQSPENALSLKMLMQGLHSINAKFVNRMDGTPGRRIWYNYWDTCLQTETSYYMRMNYVLLNPMKHGLVENPDDYPFSSYRYFVENTELEFRTMVLSQPIDDLQIEDEFQNFLNSPEVELRDSQQGNL
ncbi:MAG TPA: transposase [Anaerolineales bacterium]